MEYDNKPTEVESVFPEWVRTRRGKLRKPLIGVLMWNSLLVGATGSMLNHGRDKQEIEHMFKEGIKYHGESKLGHGVAKTGNAFVYYLGKPGRELMYLVNELELLDF